jgi:hypothetical protein
VTKSDLPCPFAKARELAKLAVRGSEKMECRNEVLKKLEKYIPFDCSLLLFNVLRNGCIFQSLSRIFR